jgi:hypothetical protein
MSHFIETIVIGQMDFTVVRYSATNNDLPSNNPFFQDNVVQVSRIGESAVLGPIFILISTARIFFLVFS